MPITPISSLRISREDRGGHGPFSWSTEVRDPRSIRLRLCGELDLDGLEELDVALPDPDRLVELLVVDLSGLDFIDCAAVGRLRRTVDQISRRGGSVRLVGACGQTARVLDSVGLPSTMRVLGNGR